MDAVVRVSVIIPTWNRAGTIEQAVRSVLSQTMTLLEVLVCDDGSTDDTEQIIEAIGDPRVRWIRGSRGGRPAIPRNHGIAESLGEWLAFLDSDDEWMPEKLEKQLASAERLNAKAACSNAHRLIPNKGIDGVLLSWNKDRVEFSDLLLENRIICSSSLIHRSLMDAAEGFPEEEKFRAIEDYALWLRVATLTDFAFVNEPLVVYRDDPVNSIRNVFTAADIFEQRRRVFENYLTWGQRHGVPDDCLARVRDRHRANKIQTRGAKLISYAVTVKKRLLK